MKIKQITTTLLFILIAIISHAQVAFNAQGGHKFIHEYIKNNIVVGDIYIDWSFGELTLVDEQKDCCVRLTQGLMQGDILLEVGALNAIQVSEIKIYPNPTIGNLKICAGFLKPGKITFTMYDAAGKRILYRVEKYTGLTNYFFDIAKEATGVYPLHVIWEPNDEVMRTNTYRIVKQ